MTLEQSEHLVNGDVLFVEVLYEGGEWLDEVAGGYAKNRKGVGTKVLFMHHHHHLPEFLFCKVGDEIAVYHYDEVSTRFRAVQ